ncbi:NSP5 [Adult diarrheal rotavirus strain J19]|uniref:Non-structural protein 5 n=1 Tax=Rotavirus X (strain RVX/Human/China/NADRV-J19/1997/GXP[X]) TaxID=335103 RepID=NSP5_ROTJ1|nr:NSP5 [Adult diarrheal rotavirus strain J19]Q45UF0.1 RecName: Full=Non-structural protein 5; Short=NSP5; AltName: Full=NS26 [Adult diarrheal rotavirus strain J19]AAZ03495.1 NSP5 [Adult diarrheal rotavirus strain J19]
MSEVPRFELRSKRKIGKKQKVDIFGDKDDESMLQIDCETDSLISESVSSTHSYEDYSKAYKELTLETPADVNDSASTIVDSVCEESWYDKTIKDEQTKEDKKTDKKLKRIEKVKENNQNDSMSLQIAQLSLRIQRIESETKLKTLDSAYNTIITQADNLTTPQKKSLISAILATMR